MTPIQIALSLLLARTCVAEIGFQDTIDECVLMWQINSVTADKRGLTLDKQTRLFNSYWKVKRQQKRRPYIMHLDGTQKPNRWQAYQKAAEIFVMDPLAYPYRCPSAVDYGAPGERPKGKVARINCLKGFTRQWYWRED